MLWRISTQTICSFIDIRRAKFIKSQEPKPLKSLQEYSINSSNLKKLLNGKKVVFELDWNKLGCIGYA